MDEKVLIDQIKRKEQDIIKTLQNIAEAALTNICIDESFLTSRDSIANQEMDDNQVDSDLNKVANEIAKSNNALLDDTSEPDFEDIIDDAVEISDCHSDLIGRDQTQCLEDSEKDVNEPVNPSSTEASMLPDLEDEVLGEGCSSGQYLSNTVQNDASPDMKSSSLDHKMLEWPNITQSPSASQASTSNVNTHKTVPNVLRAENEIISIKSDVRVSAEERVEFIPDKKATGLISLDDKSLLNKLKDLSSATKIKDCYEDSGTSVPRKYEQGLHIPTELPFFGNALISPSDVENHVKELNEKQISNHLIKPNDHYENEEDDDGYTHNDEESDLTDAAENAGSWKIDYIRVETEETNKNNLKKANFKNEKWNTCKSKKDKQSRKKNMSRRGQKLESPGKQMKKTKRKEHFENSDIVQKHPEKKKETTAMRIDKAMYMSKPRESPVKSSQTLSRKVKSIKEWHKVIELSDVSEKNSAKQQIYYDTMEPYSPTVPRGTSQRCIDALSASDLEMLNCPACQDKFFMPTTFFQHIYRKSVNINYECKTCEKVLVFKNKCSLKIHILSHLEVDEKNKVSTDMLCVMSLNDSDLQMNSDVRNLKNELKISMKDIFSHEETKDRCMECHKIISSDDMESHFTDLTNGVDLSLKCESCDKYFPTKCSLFAHRKIHKKMTPYVCPECGTFFYTWSYFKSHVKDVCMHEKRRLMYLCPTCPDMDKFAGEKCETIQHIAETHIKKYSKCDLCPSAFPNEQKLSSHISLKHKDKKSEDHFVRHLYKTQSKEKSLFFSSKKALIEHLESTLEIESFFVFYCDSCHSNFWTATDLLSHSMSCNQSRGTSELFPDETVEDSRLTEILDNLKQIQDDSQCSSCLKYNESFQKHIERHQRNLKENLKVEIKSVSENKSSEESDKPRLTRNMKRSKSSTDESNKKLKLEETVSSEPVAIASPPLRLKIKLTPEIAKSIDSASIASSTPPKKPNVRQKSPKVKFNVPPKKEPMVESLGIDVPSGKDLILLNRLFHSPDAFANGSIVTARPESAGYVCSVCNFEENNREAFLSHISQHKLCQSYFQCKECGACFAAEPSWKKHLLLIHRIKNPGPEDYCQDLAIKNLLPLFQEDERDPYEFEDSGSETGNLVIDTGEDYPEYTKLISSANTPTKCLACNAQMATTAQLKEHRCSSQDGGKIAVNR
eukprot:TRINITY_DN19458_c0_g1_i1.p1 TRINITY_DN19458_c0_g1~~TRINITY_DN19458_c0_g1_i1.p1  ORF type:complete len:1182 (+),score=289.95 TRINITY_DN19458_c0_g1_i1:127-3672(+)